MTFTTDIEALEALSKVKATQTDILPAAALIIWTVFKQYVFGIIGMGVPKKRLLYMFLPRKIFYLILKRRESNYA